MDLHRDGNTLYEMIIKWPLRKLTKICIFFSQFPSPATDTSQVEPTPLPPICLRPRETTLLYRYQPELMVNTDHTQTFMYALENVVTNHVEIRKWTFSKGIFFLSFLYISKRTYHIAIIMEIISLCPLVLFFLIY